MTFYKFDGAGNDFILLDTRGEGKQPSEEAVARLCHRRTGIGADGLMTLSAGTEGYDFRMRYYNSDGFSAAMCGNGGRCIALFAHLLGLGRNVKGRCHLRFLADDGLHEADILQWDSENGRGVVSLTMRNVPTKEVQQVLQGQLIDTGVPHYVQRVTDLAHLDVVGEGRRLRHHPELGPQGATVDFIEHQPDGTLCVRTYERGVEDETLACGTGVTAVALLTGIHCIHAKGGDFEVAVDTTDNAFTHICLIGPVSYNFSGNLTWKI